MTPRLRDGPNNPFQYGRELSGGELVDRAPELAQIEATIRNRGKLFVIGPRRYGKTSLLSVAAQSAAEQGVLVLRYDAEKYETVEVLARALLTGAVRGLNTSVERLSSLLGEVASRLRPTLSIDPQDGSVRVSLGVQAAHREELPLLIDALDAIDRLALRAEREVAVMLDEVQQIVIEHGASAERQLRATIQQHRQVAYVFAGSATRLLTAMTTDANRPFYRLGARLFLGPIPAQDFLIFLSAGFKQGGFSAAEPACRRILELAEDVPYNVQRLAHEAWEMLRAAGGGALTEDRVGAALERIVRMEDPAYTQVWTALTRNQKKTLKALIEMGGENLQSAEVTRRFSIPSSSVQSALKTLEELHLIRPDSARAEVRYRLVDPFLAAWLRLVQDT